MESVNDDGEDESDIAGIVVCQVYDPSAGHDSGCGKQSVINN